MNETSMHIVIEAVKQAVATGEDPVDAAVKAVQAYEAEQERIGTIEDYWFVVPTSHFMH